MKIIAVLLVLMASLVSSEEWRDHLSPRMQKAFAPMGRPDWRPQQAATLTAKEERELKQLWDYLRSRPAPAKPAKISTGPDWSGPLVLDESQDDLDRD